MGQNLKNLVVLSFKGTSTLSRGILKQRRGKSTIHFNGDPLNTELLFQTVHSVNQISVRAAVADWCYQFALTNEEKTTSRCSRGQWSFDHGGTTNGNVGISSEPGTWKQDARKRELPNIGKDGTDDIII